MGSLKLWWPFGILATDPNVSSSSSTDAVPFDSSLRHVEYQTWLWRVRLKLYHCRSEEYVWEEMYVFLTHNNMVEQLTSAEACQLT